MEASFASCESAATVAQRYRRVLLADVNDVLDENGRPVGEIRASVETRRAVKSEYALCPYSGSRRRANRLMNLSALHQVISSWPEALGVLQYVRNGCIAESEAPPLIELARTTAVALAVPAFLLFSEPCRLNGAMPAFVSAAHKMCAGLFGLCKNRLLLQAASGFDYREVKESPATLYRCAEESGALLSRTGVEACAGPPRLMIQALELLATGKCRGGFNSLPAEMLIGREESLLQYANSVIDLTLWVSVFAICCHEAVDNIHRRVSLASRASNPSLFRRAQAAAEQYKKAGFSDPTVAAIFHMPKAVRAEYAQGAAGLIRHADPRPALVVFNKKWLASGDDDVAILDGVCHLMRTDIGETNLAGVVQQVLALEHVGVRIFGDLLSTMHEGLGSTPPPRESTAKIMASVFGLLPSEYLSEVLCTAHMSAAGG